MGNIFGDLTCSTKGCIGNQQNGFVLSLVSLWDAKDLVCDAMGGLSAVRGCISCHASCFASQHWRCLRYWVTSGLSSQPLDILVGKYVNMWKVGVDVSDNSQVWYRKDFELCSSWCFQKTIHEKAQPEILSVSVCFPADEESRSCCNGLKKMKSLSFTSSSANLWSHYSLTTRSMHKVGLLFFRVTLFYLSRCAANVHMLVHFWQRLSNPSLLHYIHFISSHFFRCAYVL